MVQDGGDEWKVASRWQCPVQLLVGLATESGSFPSEYPPHFAKGFALVVRDFFQLEPVGYTGVLNENLAWTAGDLWVDFLVGGSTTGVENASCWCEIDDGHGGRLKLEEL